MTQHRPERRARNVAWMGLVFQVLLAAFLIILTLWSHSEAMRGLAILTSVGTLIWLFLVLVYTQRVRVQDENLESEQLLKERQPGAAIFDVDDEQLLINRRRLRWMYRWMLPAFTVLIIGALVWFAIVGWPWNLGQSISAGGWPKIDNPGVLVWFVAAAAFLAFLFSRYATGMARQPEWRLLRAGASYLMGVTLGAVAVAFALAALHFDLSPLSERALAYALRILLLVLAAETTLNFVLDFYRPREADEEPRPAFDSRLLGLFSEPGGIARSIAEAVNYQFGFEVSSTWFYQLLQRSVVPLLIFAAAALLASSSLVFVDTKEQAVVEHFGRLARENGAIKVLGPGIHLKYPWPFAVAHKESVAKVHELKIGISPSEEESKGKDELILWTNKHTQEPHLEVLIATPKLAGFLNLEDQRSTTTQPARQSATSQPSQAVPVSMLRVAVSIQYRIRDIREWIAAYSSPEKMLESIANREIIRFCASVDVGGIMGSQRVQIENSLRERVQQAADQANLNIDIAFLGLQGVHPPESTAEDFQHVVGAEQKKNASISNARAEARKRLSEVAGDETRANRLADAIRKMNELNGQAGASEEARRVQRELVELQVREIGGQAAQRITEARARRWQLENAAEGQAMAFVQEMDAKNAAPGVYKLRKVLDAAWDELGAVRKYVLTGGARTGTLQLNLQDPMSAGLGDLGQGQK